MELDIVYLTKSIRNLNMLVDSLMGDNEKYLASFQQKHVINLGNKLAELDRISDN